MTETERIAYHEAGHAVVAHYLGYKIGDATIVPDPVEGARAGILIAQESQTLHDRFIHPSGEHDAKSLQDWLPVLMAGIAAVELILGEVDIAKWMEASDDINEAHRIAEEYGYRDEVERTSMVGSAMIKAETILKSRRQALDALAKELLRAETMTGEQVSALIQRT